MQEITFAMIKPDAVAAGYTGEIITAIEKNGFEIVGMKKLQMHQKEAEAFYQVHSHRPFFPELVSFIISGPVVVMALKKHDAIKAWRDLMGETDPKKAADNTMRKRFGSDIGKNATHGSDAAQTAQVELAQFFPELI